MTECHLLVPDMCAKGDLPWRELRKDILAYEEVVNLIKVVVLMKIVWGNSDCYEKQVREFLVNIP
ncbi:hypothetical protein A2U01_0104298, partial [Trifolium medium]|nr:hypothetical protein [Trifolium medium]